MFGVGGGGGMGSAADVPILSSPTDGTPTNAGATDATVSSTAGSGTLYVGVVSDGGAATNAEIIAGSGGNLVAGASTSQAVTASGTQTVAAITGLAAATQYQILYLHVGGNNQQSNQASVGLLTTA
jgi:hypothetical protein